LVSPGYPLEWQYILLGKWHNRLGTAISAAFPKIIKYKRRAKLRALFKFDCTFKDALDPYRRNFRDGIWQRLVSLFKMQIQEIGNDFTVFEGHDLNFLCKK
jgi:hypothetical protein